MKEFGDVDFFPSEIWVHSSPLRVYPGSWQRPLRTLFESFSNFANLNRKKDKKPGNAAGNWWTTSSDRLESHLGRTYIQLFLNRRRRGVVLDWHHLHRNRRRKSKRQSFVISAASMKTVLALFEEANHPGTRLVGGEGPCRRGRLLTIFSDFGRFLAIFLIKNIPRKVSSPEPLFNF